MICMCAYKPLIVVSRITLPKEIIAILDRLSEKKFFDCNLFCDGDRQKLHLSTHNSANFEPKTKSLESMVCE